MNVLDLFSGIGGFSLGLERAGMRTVAFCEIDPFCRAVLRKHWPAVPCYGDIQELSRERLLEDGIEVDAICGGFPCQDISTAGSGKGLKGERSGLWREYARLIGELRPRFVIVENVSNLLSRGLGTVLGDLAALRYDAEWHCIPAAALGAPHIRDRIWIVAYPLNSDADRKRPHRTPIDLAGGLEFCHEQIGQLGSVREDVADADGLRKLQPQGIEQDERRRIGDGGWWDIEPDVGRVAHGVPARVDRLKSLGNAVVPQIPEIIGRAIIESERGV
jgi:DNA (cytosine-5)-methyltransferase 1